MSDAVPKPTNRPDRDGATLDVLAHVMALAASTVCCAERHATAAKANAEKSFDKNTREAISDVHGDLYTAAELITVADWLFANPTVRARLQAAVDRVDRDRLWQLMASIHLPIGVFRAYAEDAFGELSEGCREYVDKLIEYLDKSAVRSHDA